MALDIDATPKTSFKQVQTLLPATVDLQRFAMELFGGGAADAIADYPEDGLAALARDAFAFTEDKPRGRHKIRARRVSLTLHDKPCTLTVVEILNDDMPFLVDSLMAEIQARGLMSRLVLHPILKVRRSATGRLEAVVGPGDRNWSDGTQESFITVHLGALSEEAAADLVAALSAVLDDVRIAVTDWHTMLARLDRAVEALERNPPGIAPGLLSESLAFCRWLRDGNFTFLGLREFRLQGDIESGDLVPVDGSGLGVLRDPSVHVLTRGGESLAMTPEIRRYVFTPEPLIITKSNVLSRIHRRAHMDYVGLKIYAAGGEPAGELRVVGLFTSAAYTQAPGEIPFLRHKVESVLAKSGYAPGGHDAKALSNVLATFPRDELFRIGDQKLLEWARGIVDLELRPRVRVFARPDRFDRFVSVLVYTLRDRFTTGVRERISQLLAESYNGRLTAFTPFFPEGPMVRVHFIIGRNEGPRPEVDEAGLERQITEITRTWGDQLAAVLSADDQPAAALDKYREAFSAGYAETFTAQRALEDILRIERLGPDRPVAIDFHREAGMPATRVRAAVYRFDKPIPLSERVPVLENLGFSAIDERSYRVMPRFPDGVREVALHDMVLERADGLPIDLAQCDARMEGCFLAVFRGEADNDGFNRLVVAAGADWREVAVLRSYAAYLRQMRAPFGPRYLADTLTRHAGMARDLVELFRTRFDPGVAEERRSAIQADIAKRLESALAQVESLDEDRILRHYLNLIMATVRTNFFQTDAAGAPKPAIAFKIASKSVDGLPEPKPFREIWVYSPRVEGVHLRFAAIARGGIRWSDRAQDFRTEVLGLCRAQQVKNTVIVPTGAKGGFLPKQMPRAGSRDEVMKEGIASYRVFISALLDITDNIKDGRIVPPPRVVRHDADDPYLVVAADKGTATFSDYANEISAAYGHWLGDAFASGGSVGYDHKKMAITARGAWECVKRHFREIDIDIQTTPFRVVGVGDMSGDVFGNGMLLSPAIKLVAAFDHRDIFIDPEPDPAVGLAERQRLFDLPRSSWQDYDKAKISKGGGVFSRSGKSIPLSPETRALLGVTASAMTPAELINTILRCETDLLWFGGIGTYIRASTETDDQAGDRANDAVRITGLDVRAKVIGEGANLGVTQRGRIEYAARGGRINTDFIDNSAGVNSSDQEVNIKIAVSPPVIDGRLSQDERNRLLASMTDDVAAGSLANNYQQSLALSLAELRSVSDLGYLARLTRALEGRGLIDRKLEALPSRSEMAQKQAAGAGLTRPELAVLLSWAKIALSADLLAGTVSDHPVCDPILMDYFPPALRERFHKDLEAHRLRREIIVTGLTNQMINHAGPAMAVRLADESGRGPDDIAYAYLAATSAFDLPALWRDIDALDGKITGQRQLELYARVQDLLLEQIAGFLRRGVSGDLGTVIDEYRRGIATVAETIVTGATERQQAARTEDRQRLEGFGVPPLLAARLADLDLLVHVPAITRLARETAQPGANVARIAFAVADYLHLDELKARAGALKVTDYYDRLALNGAVRSLETAARTLAREVLAGGTPDLAQWEKSSGARFAKVKPTLDEMAAGSEVTVSRLTVVASQVRDLAGG